MRFLFIPINFKYGHFCFVWFVITSQLTGSLKEINSKNRHSKIDQTKSLMTNGSLMKVKSIAECSPWSDNWS